MNRDKLITNLSRALWDTDLIASRMTLALAEFAWTVMLLWPGDTFSRPTYKHMAMVANEEVWGVVFLLTCVFQATIVLADDMHSRFAQYFAGFNAVLWVYVGCLSPWMSVFPPPAAMGGEAALAFTALWIWVRPHILAKGLRRE